MCARFVDSRRKLMRSGSNFLTSFVECLASFGENGADRVVELILSGMRGEKMPLRCVRPDEKTIKNARWCLVDND
jgi:hypothetical protein